MLAAYGRHMRVSPGPTRRTLVVSIEALLDARGGKNLRAALTGSGSQKPLRERARARCVHVFVLQAVSFREAVRVEAPTQGAGSESGYCILYGLQIVCIRPYLCAHHSSPRPCTPLRLAARATRRGAPGGGTHRSAQRARRHSRHRERQTVPTYATCCCNNYIRCIEKTKTIRLPYDTYENRGHTQKTRGVQRERVRERLRGTHQNNPIYTALY